MKLLVIGSGGREYALAWKLGRCPAVTEVVCVPGNGGTARLNKCRNVEIAATDIAALIELAEQERFDLTIVGPEAPLCAGIVDQWPKDLLIWGPKAYAAQLEGSKIFAKQKMETHGIPTAPWQSFDSAQAAYTWLNLQDENKPWVVKADGLAAGKGVLICRNRAETFDAIGKMAEFGEAGRRFIIEELLEGREVSLFLLCGNGQIEPLETAQDYKRGRDGDEGPNTGGMGAYSPANHLSVETIAEIIDKLRPMIEDVGFTGSLYVGLMLTAEGWKVLEFNVRMGDPETQVVLPRLETDLFELLRTMAKGETWPEPLKWSTQACVTVVMTAGGYPGDYHKGYVIDGLDFVEAYGDIHSDSVIVFHAGTKLLEDQFVTNGGRVLNVTALSEEIAWAADHAYQVVDVITWPDEYHRTDIAKDV